MLDNHFVECEKLKTFYDQKVLDERKANSEVRLKVQSFNQFDSSQSQASKEDANIIFEMILNEETNLLNVKLVQLEKCVEEKLKFENDLEEECELELLTLISDLNYKSLPVLYAIVAHKEEIKILRAEFQSLRKSLNDYASRNRKKKRILSEAQVNLRKASAIEWELKMVRSTKPEQEAHELIKLDDEISSLEKKIESLLLENQNLEGKENKLSQRYQEIANESAYYRRELAGIEQEIKSKKIDLERVKYDLSTRKAKSKAKNKIENLRKKTEI